MDKKWFTETCKEAGSAFSLEIERKLHDEHSRHQRIEVFKTTQFGNLMALDGCIMLSSRDNFIYHEMLVHPVLFSHDDPRKVCIVGGGDCGSLSEVLKHSGVKKVTLIELDERVTCLAEAYFPELCESNGDERIKFLFEDGVAWMQQAKSESQDVIIIDSTDPVGPGARLIEESFYQDCFRVLREGGLLVQQSESPLVHMDLLLSMRASLQAAGATDLKTLFFPQAVYPSGWWTATLACKGQQIEGFRGKDISSSKLNNRYYNEEIHRSAFAMPEFFRQQINNKPKD